MSSPRITSGERRGLIVLIIILAIVTLLLCWRDRSLRHHADGLSGSHAVSVEAMADSLLVSSSQDTASIVRGRKVKRKKRERKATPAPATRSPRDERVD